MQPLHFLAVIPGGVRVFEVQASGGKFLRVPRSTFTVLFAWVLISPSLLGAQPGKSGKEWRVADLRQQPHSRRVAIGWVVVRRAAGPELQSCGGRNYLSAVLIGGLPLNAQSVNVHISEEGRIRTRSGKT